MKKEKAIIIKDFRLRKVRNELRSLLKLWKSDITSALHDKIPAHIVSHEDDKAIKIRKKIADLDLLERNSITTCSDCGFSNKDMVYVATIRNPYVRYTHEWICTD